ncbi:MAG: hypothetical protein AABZ23_00710 [Deltaproteobacteria bacterium]
MAVIVALCFGGTVGFLLCALFTAGREEDAYRKGQYDAREQQPQKEKGVSVKTPDYCLRRNDGIKTRTLDSRLMRWNDKSRKKGGENGDSGIE